jgi:hypothetical protein
MEDKDKKRKRLLNKYSASERRKNVSNINQKHSVFGDKRQKRRKTRQTIIDSFLSEIEE